MSARRPTVIAFDCETHLIRFRGKACTQLTPRFVCLTWAWRGEDGALRSGITTDRRRALDLFRGWCRSPDVLLVGHNTAFDVAVMLRVAHEEGELRDAFADFAGAAEGERVHDTKIREQLHAIAEGELERRKFALADLEARYLGRDRSAEKKSAEGEPDPWRLRYHELRPWPVETWPQAAIQYALDDAEGTLRVFEAQQPHPCACFQLLASVALFLGSSWGLRVDEAWALEQDEYYSAQEIDAGERLRELGLVRPDGSKDAAAVEAVFTSEAARLGVTLRTTKTGKVATDSDSRDALEEAGSRHPALVALAEYSRAQKFRSTYLAPVLDACDGPGMLCPSYSVLVASGRTSSYRPNVQNIPSRGKGAELRGCFIPRPGNVYLQCDYSTLELRTLAQCCLNFGLRSRMADALHEGRDLHLDFAARVMRLEYAEAAARMAAGDKAVKHQRTLAKIANFGYAGGMGAQSFVAYAAGFGVELTPGEATDLRDGWFMAWPEMTTYFEIISSEEVPFQGYVLEQHGPNGARSGWRKRTCPTFTSACNTLFQGLAADLVKLALWRVTKACYMDRSSPLYGYRAPIMVHDELILEGPRDRAEDASAELQRLMESAGEVFTPGVPMVAEPQILEERWTK